MPPNPISWRSILILSFPLRLGLISCLTTLKTVVLPVTSYILRKSVTNLSRICGIRGFSELLWKCDCRSGPWYWLLRNNCLGKVVLIIWYSVLVFSIPDRRPYDRRRPINICYWWLRHCELYVRKIQSSSCNCVGSERLQGKCCGFVHVSTSAICIILLKLRSSNYLPTYLSIYLSVYLSICLSIYLSI